MFEIPMFVWFALLGASVREAVGFWRAIQTFVDVKFIWRTIIATWLMAWFFGIVGGEIISQFNIFPLGINLTALFAGILSGDSITLLLKKLGWSQKFEVPVAEQQMQPDLNPRQVNALSIAKKYGKITHSLHKKINSVPSRTATRDLRDLVDRRILSQHGRGRGAYYTLRNEPHSRH